MIAATKPARKPRPKNLSSHTELSTLSQCEMRWAFKYVEKLEFPASIQMELGSLVGRLTNWFWRQGDWRAALAAEIAEEGADVALIDLASLEEQPYADAFWLMERYERHYEHMLKDVRVIADEYDARANIPGTRQNHQAIIDNLWEIKNKLWMVERKTYGRTDSLDMVDVNPQLTNNLWVARTALGADIEGIIYDGIYTYRWKAQKPTQKDIIEQRLELERTDAAVSIAGVPITTEHGLHITKSVTAMNGKQRTAWAREAVEKHPGVDRPDSESFTMLYLDRTEKHITAAQIEIRAQLKRRDALRRGADPMRNLTTWCNNCPAKSTCFERLAFPQDIEIDFS